MKKDRIKISEILKFMEEKILIVKFKSLHLLHLWAHYYLPTFLRHVSSFSFFI